MINLLPPAMKKEIRAARINVVLARYCWLFVISGIFLAAIFGVGLYITTQDKAIAEKEKQNYQLEIDKYKDVKKESEAFSANLKSAKSILSSEVVFSKLITDIAAVLPTGVILSNLNITTTTLGTPFSLTARAITYQNAVDLKTNLENSPLFEQISIQSTTQSPTNIVSESYIDRRYPVTVTLNVTLTKQKPAAAKTGDS